MTGEDDSCYRAEQGEFDATGEVPCSMATGQPMARCTFGVARAGGGGAPYETIQGALPVSVHASSVLHGSSPPTVVFTVAEQSSSDSYEIRGVTPIEATWLPDIAPQLYHTRGPAGPPGAARPA